MLAIIRRAPLPPIVTEPIIALAMKARHGETARALEFFLQLAHVGLVGNKQKRMLFLEIIDVL